MLTELEAVCARWSAVRMGSRERADLDGCHQAMAEHVRAGDRGSYREGNLLFHQLIWTGAGNVHLFELVNATSRRLAPFRGAQFNSPQRLALSHDEHGTVLAGILRGDSEKAAESIRGHIRSSGASWTRVSGQVPTGGSPRTIA